MSAWTCDICGEHASARTKREAVKAYEKHYQTKHNEPTF